MRSVSDKGKGENGAITEQNFETLIAMYRIDSRPSYLSSSRNQPRSIEELDEGRIRRLRIQLRRLHHLQQDSYTPGLHLSLLWPISPSVLLELFQRTSSQRRSLSVEPERTSRSRR